MKKSKVSRLTKKEIPAKTTRTKRSSSHEDFNISTDIKKQLLGFLILLFGVLIGLALISYSDFTSVQLGRFQESSLVF